MMTRKRGTIHIDRRILHQTPLDIMGKALSGFVVWHTESRIDLDRITYHGEHPDFEPVSEAEIPPEYEMIFDANGVAKFNRK